MSRAKIIDIAFEHFAANGYHGTSMAKIATEAGISQPGLLYHFPNKPALFQAVLVERDQRDLDGAGMRLEDLAELDFFQLLDVFGRFVERNAQNRNMVQLAHLVAAEATAADHPGHEWVVNRLKGVQRLCEGAVRRSLEAGTIRRDVDPAAIARTLIAASEGLENQWLLDPEMDLVSAFAQFVDVVRVYVAPQEPA